MFVMTEIEFTEAQQCESMLLDDGFVYSDIIYANGARWSRSRNAGYSPARGTADHCKAMIVWHQKKFDAADGHFNQLQQWIENQSFYATQYTNPLPGPTEQHLAQLKELAKVRRHEMTQLQKYQTMLDELTPPSMPDLTAEAQARRSADMQRLRYAARNIR